MTAPCSCGLYHSVTDTDPACAYECHPECGPDKRGDVALSYPASTLGAGHVKTPAPVATQAGGVAIADLRRMR